MSAVDSGSAKKPGFRDSAFYPAVYMVAVTAVLASVLIVMAGATSERVEANRQLMFEKAVVSALGLMDEERAAPAAVRQKFAGMVREPDRASAGAYMMIRDGLVSGYAVVFEGQGFWDAIRGVAGLSADGGRLIGLSFFEQNETPGLGGEITSAGFRRRFQGVMLRKGEKPLRLLPAGSVLGDGEVHAITGATQTCNRLEDMLNNVLSKWRSGFVAWEGGE